MRSIKINILVGFVYVFSLSINIWNGETLSFFESMVIGGLTALIFLKEPK